jgi:predicted RNA-binding protein
MADAAPTTKPARKRAAFTRTAKPVYAIVTLRDENGEVVKLNSDLLSIKIERDSAVILNAVLGGSQEFNGAVVKQVDLPAGPPRKAAAPAA